jgi:hypothetical protein
MSWNWNLEEGICLLCIFSGLNTIHEFKNRDTLYILDWRENLIQGGAVHWALDLNNTFIYIKKYIETNILNHKSDKLIMFISHLTTIIIQYLMINHQFSDARVLFLHPPTLFFSPHTIIPALYHYANWCNYRSHVTFRFPTFLRISSHQLPLPNIFF